MLEIKDLNHTYQDGKVAIKNINLTVENGDIFGFVGPNGAGKSTTIKAIVGILPYTSGSILVNGKDVLRDSLEVKKEIAYIPDNPDLYEGLTGIQYLNFIADVYNVGEVREELINKYASLFEIKDDLLKLIKSYSHGMRQKLAIISALIHKPKLIIMDEPFVGLDPKATFQIKELLKELSEEGCSIFFSSHVLEVVEKLCNKVAIISNGEIKVNGRVEDIIGNESLEDLFMEIAG
ncbi:MAG: ABC transporter ATP-binding protein [Acholeplasmatales bacterium]|nr:ABC transporter ATP-binding protein [Acholeplasmatales bacterium]